MRGFLIVSILFSLSIFALAQAGYNTSQTALTNVVSLLSAGEKVEGVLLIGKPSAAMPWQGISLLSRRPGVFVFSVACPREAGGKIFALKAESAGNLGLFHVGKTTYLFAGNDMVKLLQVNDPNKDTYKTLLLEANLGLMISNAKSFSTCP